MQRRLFSGEQEIQSWKTLTVTTHRVILWASVGGEQSSTSLMLMKIEWTRIARTHQPLLLLLALLFLVGGLLFSQFAMNALIVLFGAAIITMLAYLGSRKIALQIGAGDGRIEVVLGSAQALRDSARDFLDIVDSAAAAAQRGHAIVHQGART